MSSIDNNVNSIPKLLDNIINYNTMNSRSNSEKLYKLATESNLTVLPKEDINAIEKKITKFELEYILNDEKKGADYFSEIMNNLQNSRNKQYEKEGLFRKNNELKKLATEIYSDENLSKNIPKYVDKLKELNLTQKHINDADTLRTITEYIKIKTEKSDYKLVKTITSKYIKEIYSEKKIRENISDDKIPGKTFVKKPKIKTENLAGKNLAGKNKKQPSKIKSPQNLEKIIEKKETKPQEKPKVKVEKKETKLSYEQIIAQKPKPRGEKKETNESIIAKNRLSEYEAKKAKYEQEKASKEKKTNNLPNKKKAYSIKTELIKDKKKNEWKINEKLESINNYLTKQIDESLKKLIPKIKSNYISEKLKPILNYQFNLSKYKPQPIHLNVPNNLANFKISKKGIVRTLAIAGLGTAGILYAFNTTNNNDNTIQIKQPLESIIEVSKQTAPQTIIQTAPQTQNKSNQITENIDPRLTKNYFENFPIEQKDTTINTNHNKKSINNNNQKNNNNKNNNNTKTKFQGKKVTETKKISKENYFKKTRKENHFRNSQAKNHFRTKK